MALFNVNDIDNIDNTIDTEEEFFSAVEDIHPEGTFADAEIVKVDKVTGFLRVDLTTSEGSISKFYTREVVDGKNKVDPYMQYLIRAAGFDPRKFLPPMLEGKVVKITVKHYTKDTGEIGANITKFEKA